MNETPSTLDYARPQRRPPSAWREPEAALSTGANVVLATIAVGAVGGRLDQFVGIAGGLVVVAVALVFTAVFIAALGVFEAYFCGELSPVRQRRATHVFLIAAGNLGLLLAGVALVVWTRA